MLDSLKRLRTVGVLGVASLVFGCADANYNFQEADLMNNGGDLGASANTGGPFSAGTSGTGAPLSNGTGASGNAISSPTPANGSVANTARPQATSLAGVTANLSPIIPPAASVDPGSSPGPIPTFNSGADPTLPQTPTPNSTPNTTPTAAQSPSPAVGCANGQYASGGTCKAWKVCAAGTFVSTQGTATNDRVCSACNSGQFSEGENSGFCTAWLECKAGEYAIKAGTATTNRGCGACSSGTFSSGSNATQCASWQNCAAGTYVQSAGSATADRMCATCAASSFSTSVNSQQCTATGQCAAGTYQTTAATTTSAAKCSACARGNYCAGGTAPAAACPSGTWDGNNTASPCIAHTVCSSGTAASNTPNATTDRTCAAVAAVEISSVSPVDGATGVARSASVSVTFKNAMDKTVNPITGVSGCSFSWSSDGKTLTCNPSDFSAGTTISWGVSTSARDANGTALSSARSYSFRVMRSASTTLQSSTTLDAELTSDSSIDTGGAAAIGDYADNSYSQGVISFPMPKLPTGAVVTAASLSVYQAKGSGTPYTDLGGQLLAVNIGTYTSLAWSILTQPLQSPGSALLSTSDSVGFKQADVKGMLLDDVSRGAANSQFRICFQKTSDNDGVRDFIQIILSQAANDNKPSLSITYDYP